MLKALSRCRSIPVWYSCEGAGFFKARDIMGARFVLSQRSKLARAFYLLQFLLAVLGGMSSL